VSDEPNRISVSRDALRADLAELELRIRTYIDAVLATKADRAAFAEVALMVDRLNRAEFNDAQRRYIEDAVDVAVDDRIEHGWTRRERAIASIASLAAVGTMAASVVNLHHGGIL
jgi:hypothetical protein